MDSESPKVQISQSEVEGFCRKWKIAELALFGSVLRDDFNPESDIDVLVTFLPGARHSLFDRVHMQNELRKIFGRNVDLVKRTALRNPFRSREILKTAHIIYAAGRSG